MAPEQTSRREESQSQQEIFLYQELLTCLQRETQALRQGQEDLLLKEAHHKERILHRLIELKNLDTSSREAPPSDPTRELLASLKRQAFAANARNRQLIEASLEVIQDFLSQFQPAGPGLYQSAGKVEAGPGGTFFQRRA